MKRIALLIGLALSVASMLALGADDWRHYGSSAGGSRYSELDQINRDTVARLQPVWTYHTGEASIAAADPRNLPAFEATPLQVGDSLYFCTPRNVVIALDAETGKELWRFDPKTDTRGHFLVTCRGVSYFESQDAAQPCPRRIFTATLDGRLIALDAMTGKPCESFGDRGAVSLRSNLGDIKPGYYSVTSAPTIAAGRVITGGLILDNMATDMPSGVVRAFDAISGRLDWAWDPAAGTPEATAQLAPYSRGSPNAWAQFSTDEALGLVYIPTGNRAPDYWGPPRNASEERFASAVVALEITTGTVRWVFQTVHHDLWDYDIASQPVLASFPTPAGPIPALIQPTKTGQLFVLDRRSGTPLTEVAEKPVPQRGVDGESLSPTQPFSVGMPALHPTSLTEKQIWGLTPIDRWLCKREFQRYRHEGLFTPPGTQGTINYPSNLGASSWGSVSVDERSGVLIANTNRIASIVRMIPRAEADRREQAGETLYMPQRGTPYAVEVTPFLSPLGVPCTEPPWGQLTAIDLKSRRIIWQKPLGNTRDLAPLGLEFDYGVPNTGGSLVTAGGLTFIGATTDRYFRAFETNSGKEVWSASLPAGGQATPMTYRAGKHQKQFVVIAAGGHAHLGSRLGDTVIAYALTDR